MPPCCFLALTDLTSSSNLVDPSSHATLTKGSRDKDKDKDKDKIRDKDKDKNKAKAKDKDEDNLFNVRNTGSGCPLSRARGS